MSPPKGQESTPRASVATVQEGMQGSDSSPANASSEPCFPLYPCCHPCGAAEPVLKQVEGLEFSECLGALSPAGELTEHECGEKKSAPLSVQENGVVSYPDGLSEIGSTAAHIVVAPGKCTARPHAAAEPRLRKVQLAVEQVTIKDWRVGCNTQCGHSSIGGPSLELDARQTRIVHYQELSGTDRNPPGTPLSRECWGENKYAQLAGIASAGSPPGRADGQRVRDPRRRTGGHAAATGLLNGQRPGQLRTGLGAECTHNSRQVQFREALLLVTAPVKQTPDPCFLHLVIVSSS